MRRSVVSGPAARTALISQPRDQAGLVAFLDGSRTGAGSRDRHQPAPQFAIVDTSRRRSVLARYAAPRLRAGLDMRRIRVPACVRRAEVLARDDRRSPPMHPRIRDRHAFPPATSRCGTNRSTSVWSTGRSRSPGHGLVPLHCHRAATARDGSEQIECELGTLLQFDPRGRRSARLRPIEKPSSIRSCPRREGYGRAEAAARRG